MTTKVKNKFLSIVLALAMTMTLMVGMTITASADTTTNGNWSSYAAASYDGGTGTASDPYQIATAEQLALFAANVNGGEDYEDEYFVLTDDIDLTGHYWIPVGGQWTTNTGTPASSAHYFAGIFNGYDTTAETGTYHTITGLNVELGSSGIGLFGYVNGGILANISVSGTVNCTGAYNAIGGLVGYTNSSIVNCTSNVNVTAAQSSGKPSNIGGLAGIVENKVTSLTDATTVMVRGCTSTGNISSTGTRIGGLIGGAYAKVTGAVLVDRCTVSACTVSTSNTAYKTYIGGLIGYCEASVSNCLAGSDVTVSVSANTGHRMGGICGILSSYGSAVGHMAGCVFMGTLSNASSNTSYDGGLCVAESGTTVVNCFYPSGYYQSATGATNVYGLSSDQMLDNAAVTGTDYISTFLSDAAIPSWNTDLTGAWDYDESAGANHNPRLRTITPVTANAVLGTCGRGTSYSGSDNVYLDDGVYYNPTASTQGTGSFDSPFNTLAGAVSALSNKTYLITMGPISVSDYTLNAVGLNGKTIVRSYTYSGSIFTVGTNETLSLSNVTIDGNSTTRGNSTLVLVNGGTLTVNSTAALMNNNTVSRGSAIRIESGNVNFSGQISGNVSAIGGAIFVNAGATFNLDSSSGINDDQVIFLANSTSLNAAITVTAAVSTCITIESANAVLGLSVATSSEDYTITCTDVSNIDYMDNLFDVALNSALGYAYLVEYDESEESCTQQLSNELSLMSTEYDGVAVQGNITESTTFTNCTVGINSISIDGGTEEAPLVITIKGSLNLKGDIAIGGISKSYVKIVGEEGAVINSVSESTGIIIGKAGKTYDSTTMDTEVVFENITIDGANRKASTSNSPINTRSWTTVTLGKGVVIQNCKTNMVVSSEVYATSGAVMYRGNLILDGCTIKNCHGYTGTSSISVATSDALIAPLSSTGRLTVSNPSLTIKNCNIVAPEDSSYDKLVIYDVNTASGSAIAEINPTGDVSITGKISGKNSSTVNVTEQEGYPIDKVEVDGTAVTDYASLNEINESLKITLQSSEPEPAAPTFAASISNVSSEMVAAGDTFTADVVLTSDTVPASAALDLNVNSDVAKIVSITPAEGIGTTEATVAEGGAAGTVSFFGNTASAAEGLKVATVTFEAVADGTASVALTSEGAGVSGDPADYDITVPEAATVTVKTPTIEAVDFGGNYKLAKYTPQTEVAEGKTVMYGEQAMYSKDGCWYCVIDKDVTPSVDSVSITEGTATAYADVAKGDVNENEKINIVDAQLTYDIANLVYSGFDKLSALGILKADANGDMTVDASDARAIQVYVHTGAFAAN